MNARRAEGRRPFIATLRAVRTREKCSLFCSLLHVRMFTFRCPNLFTFKRPLTLKEVVEIKGGRLKAGTEAILEMLSKAIPEIVMRTFANSGNTLHTCRKEPTTSWRRCARLNNLIRSRLIC